MVGLLLLSWKLSLSLLLRWSIAGFDTMLAIFFGRPSSITYYTTNFPQDRSDDNLSDAPGSARQLLPPSNVLASETTDQTYHTAYYQLTIPSFELLEGIFHVDRQFSRSALYGWFSPPPHSSMDGGGPKRHTYRHAIRLAEDIRQWYGHLPKGMRVDKEDTAESLSESRPKKQVVQTLGLCIKTWTLMCVFQVSPLCCWVIILQYGDSSSISALGSRCVFRVDWVL